MAKHGRRRWHLPPPPDLVGWELTDTGDAFVLLEWAVPPGGPQALPQSAEFEQLTNAERDVARLILAGKSNRAIAEARGSRRQSSRLHLPQAERQFTSRAHGTRLWRPRAVTPTVNYLLVT